MVQRLAYGSPTPLIWVRILVPVRNNMQICQWANLQNKLRCFNICIFAYLHICIFFLLAHLHICKLAHCIFIMNKLTAYLKDSYKELVQKVTWPSWDQLQQSTMIVLGATLVITFVVGVMDFAASNSLKFIYSLFK
jgi:preprotein translocase subunit SecE